MTDFKDDLPLDGEVTVHWEGDDPETGIYLGYQAGNPQRCAVRLSDRETTAWVNRSIIKPGAVAHD